MRLSLLWKLAGSFALVVIGFTAVLVIAFQVTTAASFVRLVNQNDETRARSLKPLVEQWFSEGGWDEVRRRILEATQMSTRDLSAMRGMMSQGAPGEMAMHLWGHGRIVVTTPTGRIVVDSQGELSTSAVLSPRQFDHSIPFGSSSGNQGRLLVGTMIAPQITANDRQFLDSMNGVLVMTSLISTMAATFVGFLLFRGLVRPLRLLTAATEAVRRGDYSVNVPILSHDELGEISQRFNLMAKSLAESRDRQRQFVADAAHELRTPVSLLQSTLEMMVEKIYPADHERLAALHRESVRLGQLVADLQILSWNDSGRLKLELGPVSLSELVTGAVSPFEPVAENQGVALVTQVPDVTIVADGPRLTRVLANLLANALRFSPRGGAIRIKASLADRHLQIRVEDDGPGVSPVDVERIFDRFYRADASRSRDKGGSGLGLAICRSLVEAHGGTIGVDPSPGGCFVVTLPL